MRAGGGAMPLPWTTRGGGGPIALIDCGPHSPAGSGAGPMTGPSAAALGGACSGALRMSGGGAYGFVGACAQQGHGAESAHGEQPEAGCGC